MSGIMEMFGGGKRSNQPKPQSLAPRFQSSVEGRPRAVGAGQNRLAGNVVWYGDYRAIPQAAPGSAGGKGGIFGGAATGTGKGTTQSYTYTATFMVSIGETIAAVQAIINGQQYDFFYEPPAALVASLQSRGITVTYGNTFGGTFLLGDYAQSPWSYMVTAHPDQALAYRGEALACFPNLALGSSPALPNFNFEVLWPLNTDVAAYGPDANPADWVQAFLSNADWGAGFPEVLLGDFTGYQTWARATGMLVSPLVDGQTSASSHLTDLMRGTVADFVWSSGSLTVVPYAEGNVNGNGYLYEAPVTPIYDLTDVDFLPCEHGPSAGSAQTNLKVSRIDPTTVNNRIPVEYLDRANLYNPVTIYDEDDALIISSGRTRTADVRTCHFFCAAPAANMSAQLQMQRAKVLQTFYFTLPPQFILLDPMDIVTITLPAMGLDQQPVRIIEIQKNSDGALEFTAEEFFGAVAATLYERQQPLGAGRNVNQDPGNIHDPIIFEPTEALGGGLQIWTAVAGLDLDIWGGCNVWVSSEAGGTYQQVGVVYGAARMGETTNELPTVTSPPSGPTVDNTNTLGVDLTISEGELASGSATDMLALDTACYIGGEVIAYQDATLTGAYAYDLAPMVRGAYDTTISTHAAGTPFVRLDDLLVKIPFTQDRVGAQIYIKFQSFNRYGGGLQSLADIGSYQYTIQGTALASPLPDITQLRMTYRDNISAITWDEVEDFRPVRYEIRTGGSWDTGISLGTVAHPPFTTFGDNTYMVKARAEPVPGLVVYSENALSIVVAGSVIPENIVATYDEPDTGWLGTITGPGAIVGGNFVTTAANEIAYYEVPDAHTFDVLYNRPSQLNSTCQVVGVPVGDDILTNPDFLGSLDILGSANTRFVDGWVEVLVQTGGAGDVFAATDVFDLPDVFGGGDNTDWVKYAPGVVYGRFFKHRLAIISRDEGTVATATVFTNSVDVPTRVDHYTNLVLDAAGELFTFAPDGVGEDVPFNGGPDNAALPQVFVAVQDGADGDYVTVTGLTLSDMTVQVLNAGVGVERTVNITVEGW